MAHHLNRRLRTRAAASSRAALAVSLAALLLLGPPGCSLFVDSRQDITIEASDPAARLFVDGREVGTGRAVVPLRRNDTYAVRAELPDGRIARARISKGISTTGILDIVGGIFFLVPFIGIAAPGFWNLDPDYVFLSLSGVQPSTRPAP